MPDPALILISNGDHADLHRDVAVDPVVRDNGVIHIIRNHQLAYDTIVIYMDIMYHPKSLIIVSGWISP
jgi:hypothetical protein